jgi:hypothetical protein
VGKARWFWQAVATAAAEHPGLRLVETYFVAGRDVEGADAITRAQDCPNNLARICEGSAAASPRVRLAMLADQPRLCAADCRDVEQQAEVAGEAEAARMRVTLAVD